MNKHKATGCPSCDSWATYLDPLSSDDPRLDTHLEKCCQCRETLQWLAAEPTWWDDVPQLLHPGSHAAVPERLLTSICALSVTDEVERGEALREFELQQLQPMMAPASHPELIGRINRYELEQLVGRGGMGLVFRGRDTELHRVVAVKTLAIHLIPIGTARERFIREARASAGLIHPHIVPVYDVVTDGAIPALVMQYIAGPTLEAWIARHGPLPWEQVLQLGIQLSDALAAAHEQGLVHRDIKPGNVLLEADGARALLSDFGLARALDDATLTHSGMLTGTPDYMSPEQARGQTVGPASDLFSLGSMLYAMLTGHPPFRASEPMAVMNRICHQPHVPLANDHPEIPLEIARMIDKLLSKEAKRRFGSAAELREHLQQLLHARLHLQSQWRPRRFALAVGGPLLVVGAAAVALSLWPAGDGSKTRSSSQVATQLNSAAPVDDPGMADAQTLQESIASMSSLRELRWIDEQLEQLERDVQSLDDEFAAPDVEQVLTASAPWRRSQEEVDAVSLDLQRLEAELLPHKTRVHSGANFGQ